MARPSVVVVDTNVFGADLLRRGAPLAKLYRPLLEGRAFVLSFQTVAELRFGAQRQGWGSRRLAGLDQRLARAEVVWAGPELLAAYVALRVSCESVGHGLAQPHHDSDRWIAATAIRLGSRWFPRPSVHGRARADLGDRAGHVVERETFQAVLQLC